MPKTPKANAMERKHTTITIPSTLFTLLEEKMAKTGFSSVSAYATYVLRETMMRMMQDEMKASKDKKKIVERLRSLGYI